ncbi:type III secretion system protein [Candidatus Chlamydia corallus]|uniref:type III secretion system protein n=1 Tax=Candidatus Chlamydia corallus TaxID=2038470 RepID=UPI000C2FF21B|nr:type III secretion system protein [Candidatus Chlamydia corallus]
MFFQNLAKKLTALGVSPLGCLLVIGAVSCAILFEKSSKPSSTPTPAKTEKISGNWLKLTQMGNPKLIESLAKKEQLEKDLTSFHPIVSSKVAIALPTEDDVIAPLHLSVILTLGKEESLTPSLLFSITDYLCSSLPGLKREHISLSDNLGNLYMPASITINSLLIHTLENYLSKIFPKEHFAFAYHGKENKPTLQLTLNESYLSHLAGEELKKIITHITHYLHQNYDDSYDIVIETLPFARVPNKKSLPSKVLIGSMILAISLMIVSLASFYLARHAYERVSPEPKKIKRGINISKLLEIIQKESPEKIALILSYLDPKKAEALLNRLPEDLKHQVLKYKL